MIERLFVYGTLMPGQPNEGMLNQIGGSWEPATIAGTLHRQGWGPAMGHLGIVLNAHAAAVEGFLFASDNLCNHWAALDDFEGEAYTRVLTTARIKDGSAVQAYIYALSAHQSRSP